MTRRRWFAEAFAGVTAVQLTAGAQTAGRADASKFGIPGLFRGRVVSVYHAGSIADGQFGAEPIAQMIDRGMRELTGTQNATDAWKLFFEPGDVVGIKVNPVGQPHVISNPHTLGSIIAGLRSAGLKPQDIVVYDRYGDQLVSAGFPKWLPDGVRTAYAVNNVDPVQQAIEGYDPDHYMDMALTLPGQDATNLTARRSYAARFLTKEVNKLINLGVVKDHQSAGVTLALKNLSHGFVNNVARSHSTKTLNACGAFIPAVVAMPVLRQKAVLHIVDGIKALYHGGPGSRPQFVWEHKTLYFATDPVALDHIGWKVIDAKRVSVGMRPLTEDTPDRYSTFLHRQPEHVEIAGALGLGEWEEKKIQLRSIRL